jgi:FtsZ-binding cell division protein ZapB
MKRALAERAKQSASIGGTNPSSEPQAPYNGGQQPPQTNDSVSSPAPVPSLFTISHAKNSETYQHPQSPSSQPPTKIAKIDTTTFNQTDVGVDASRSQEQHPKPDAAPSSSSSNSLPGPSAPQTSSLSSSPVPTTLRPPSTVANRSTSLGGAGHKRPREAPQADSSNASSSSTNAFYLQHQNRALAVELRSLQHSLRLLERERDQRRKDCSGAVQALHRLQATWTQLETALLSSTEAATTTIPTSKKTNASDNASNHDATEATSFPIPSTGSSESVEWTLALSRALMALGKEEGVCDGQIDVQCDRIASSLAARAAVLQEVLWKVLREAGADATRGNHAAASAAAASRTEVADRQAKVQEAMGEIHSLQAQVEELKAARNAAVASERKVRRNVYRLAANMINVDQLMAAIQDDTEIVDTDLQHEIVKQQLLKQAQSAVPVGDPSNSSGNGGRPSGEPGHSADADALAKHAHASAATIDAMKTRITDLERTLANRDDSIEQVRNLTLDAVSFLCAPNTFLCCHHS